MAALLQPDSSLNTVLNGLLCNCRVFDFKSTQKKQGILQVADLNWEKKFTCLQLHQFWVKKKKNPCLHSAVLPSLRAHSWLSTQPTQHKHKVYKKSIKNTEISVFIQTSWIFYSYENSISGLSEHFKYLLMSFVYILIVYQCWSQRGLTFREQCQET